MKYLYVALATVLIAAAIFLTGIQYERRAALRAQVKQLKSDAVAVTTIEKKDDQRKSEIRYIVKTVAESVPPTDCLNQPMPAAALNGLREAGIRTRPETH